MQITVGRLPVTGLRLFLEGSKQNRLSVHLQHLSSLPKILRPYWDTDVTIGAPKWQGPEEQDSRWFEPVKWKNFSHVSTAPVENPETFIGEFSGIYVVTGVQLGVWDFGPRSVLYMKLLFSRLPGCTIRRSFWDHTPTNPDNSSFGSRENNTTGSKLFKYVDLSEMSKGPQDPPGHWLVTSGKSWCWERENYSEREIFIAKLLIWFTLHDYDEQCWLLLELVSTMPFETNIYVVKWVERRG